ncbi:elongation factor EF-2 [Candidatus Micrarchaeota archaeon]|nr:MAG: elongation factor EF-2 [Candidatus Micrarchaeota archaeon]
MGRIEKMAEKVRQLMDKQESIRNIGIVAHIDHGKTTMTDNLIAGAGLMSEDLAGKELVMDSYELEAERGITIMAANISMVYNHENKEYLINLIDTPGHVDFGGEVTRAMRAVDGVVVVVCAVEGVMPQTETVLKQALKEKVKPILYINKVDRLINELKVDEKQMQERFIKIINRVNELIGRYAHPEFKEKWKVKVSDGSVVFGSAYNNWAISVPLMQKTGIGFKQIYEYSKNEQQKELAKKIPGYLSVVDAIIKHLPNPKEAQRYRIPHIWKGDANSDIGKDMIECNADGKTVIMITSIDVDPHAGEIATGRVYSGKVKKGDKLYLINSGRENTVQQVAIYMNTGRVQMEEIPAGNIAAISGLRDAYAGETAAVEKIEPFESIKHYSEPVMTKSIEAKNPKDLPRLIEVLRQVAKEDPTVKVEINEETGEHLVSGMGELHLEIVEHIIQHDKGVEITTSRPIVLYRETVTKPGKMVEGKSPNKHNKFYLTAEPMPENIYKAIIEGEIPEGKPKNPKELAQKLREYGIDKEEAKKVWDIYNHNMFIDVTKGVQYLNETKELIIQAFEEAMREGPLAQEKCTKVIIKLHDAKLHEDAVHRGPSQVIPAVKRAILAAMLYADAQLMEPKQKLFINVPQEYMNAVTKQIQGMRGQILNMEQDEDHLTIVSKVPVSKTFGFAAEIRSATQGRAMWSTEYAGYELLPRELQEETIKQIRERKGLGKRKTAEGFLE